jgi:outer membrane biosynthesis protein TonB
VLQSGDEFQIGEITIEFFIGVPRPKKMSEETAIIPPQKVQAVIPAQVPIQPVAQPVVQAPVQPPAAKVVPPQPKAPTPAQVPPKQSPPLQAAQPKVVIPQAVPKAPQPKTNILSSVVPVAQSTMSEPHRSGPVKPWPKQKSTFAPPSVSKINDIIKPSKGNVVEVVLVWKDRVFATRHFEGKNQVVQIGSNPDNQIVLPLFGSVRASHPLVNITLTGATILLTDDMTGEVVKTNQTLSFEELRKKGLLTSSGVGSSYSLGQDEMVKVNLGEGVLAIVRYVANGPSSKLLPFIDLSVNQLTGIIIGLMAVSIFMFYAYLYAPALPDQSEEEQEPPRKAQFFYKKQAVPIEVTEEKEPTPKAAVQEKTKAPPATAQGEEGASREPKKTANATSRIAQQKAVTKNTSNANPGAAAKAKPQKDVTKSGLLGAFATKGLQDQLNKAFAGSGNVSGLSKSATGSAANGEGSDVGGSALRDTGANGNGTATVGIAGVKTKGRGGGLSGYGTGTLGAKKNASLVAGDTEATFSNGIDKEAIRRVVQENLKQIKACYERGLNHNPGLYGKIVIQWTIGPGGKVLAASIKNTTMDSSEVENCAVSRLRTWKFPEPPAGEEAEVSYPFVFQAQE